MLIAVPVPQIDESPSSILMRTALLNGWESVRPMLRLIGVPQSGVLQGGAPKSWRAPELYAKYMNELGINLPKGVGAYRQHKTLEGIRVFIDEKIDLPSLVFRPEGSTFCPLCLIEKPYLRRIWSLKLLDTCSIHHCDLQRLCPNCDQIPGWDRGAPQECRCGFDLGNCPTTFEKEDNSKAVLKAIKQQNQPTLDAMSKDVLRQEKKRHRRNAHLPWAYLRY
jgi:hypothetical protein